MATDRLNIGAAASGHVADHAARPGDVPLVVVRMAAEDQLHAVAVQQALQVSVMAGNVVQVEVAGLGCVVRVQREMKERKLEPVGMLRKVTLEPLVLSGPRSPVRIVVHLVRAAVRAACTAAGVARVRVCPGRVKHVEPHAAGGERVVRGRVSARLRAIDRRVRHHGVRPAGGGHGRGFRPDRQ